MNCIIVNLHNILHIEKFFITLSEILFTFYIEDMRNRFLLTLIVLISSLTVTFSQSTNIPYNQDYYHLIDRYAIKNGAFPESFHGTVRPYGRQAVAQFTEQYKKQFGGNLSLSDRFNMDYLMADNWVWLSDSTQTYDEVNKPFLRYLYEKKADFYHKKVKGFDVHVNPVLHAVMGQDNEVDYNPYYNTRGLTMYGTVDNKIGFYIYLADNLSRLPGYVERKYKEQRTLPGEGFVKVGEQAQGQYDFFTARGYITFPISKSISGQFGYDRNFVGNGYRSLILSDFANDYLFLKLNTKVWKLNYTNIFAQMIADNDYVDKRLYPKKYFTFHHLSLDILDNLNIGLFESVMFGREEQSFDMAYMNPMIFYHTVEHNMGDGDGVLIGMDFKWNIWKKIQLYGQLVLDDLKFNDLFGGEGWYANKQSLQLGGRYIDAFGIDNLDLQGEVNIVKPYMYSHYSTNQNLPYIAGAYHHYNQPLAHPMGANFKEFVGILRYQPNFLPRLNLTFKGIYTDGGLNNVDKDGNVENWGSSIFEPYTTYVNEYGNSIGQGIATKNLFADATVSYQLLHNLFIDLKHIHRDQVSDREDWNYTTNFTSVGLRWNATQRVQEF